MLRKRRMSISRLTVIALVLSLLAIPVATVAFAAPSDGVYNIAVLEVGNWNEWTTDDFTQLGVSPGMETYTWATIPASSLTAPGLAPYDVLIVPWHHDYAWLDSSKAMSIVTWVNSGNVLIVHNYLFDIALTNDPLTAAFGSKYHVDWTGEDGGYPGDSVVIIDPTSPLVSSPNTLLVANLNDWYRTVHNSVDPSTAGSAWNWAINSADSGYHWLGYALSGSGAIVLCAGDPEYHSTNSPDPQQTEARKLIENEIIFEGVIEVNIDVKPGSWPNPINVKSKGVFAVAICGTKDFNVKTVDPVTVKLYIAGIAQGVSPIRWSYEDVATGDGYLDIVFHFDTQTVVTKLGLAGHMGETIPLIIKGNLHPAAGGLPIQGQDYVWILKK